MGEYCPFDGWTSAAPRELTRAVERLVGEDRAVSLEELRKTGVSAATLDRTIVIEFGCDASSFDAFSAREFVIGGKARTWNQLSPAFK
jgi:hypothetical protein